MNTTDAVYMMNKYFAEESKHQQLLFEKWVTSLNAVSYFCEKKQTSVKTCILNISDTIYWIIDMRKMYDDNKSSIWKHLFMKKTGNHI